MDFIVPSTIDTAKALLGVKVIYNDDGQIYSGYIVETEAYLGFDDRAAHGFGGKQTPKVTSLYQRGGTIYGHIMHTHLLINFVTQQAGVPEGVLIRAIEPVDGIEAMKMNRGKYGYELTNGPGKWTKAFHIPRAIDGTLLNVGRLSIDTKNRKYPREIEASARIGIPNKGIWTSKPLRYTVKGNPYVSRIPKKNMRAAIDTWK
ncbi:DNA-3-methyladenine glycosylase [Staphylococcus lugdunensis]|jgi:DNA-3-methyladenine glycosylase|uniref:DNA-3-methyladenine glycosylase n=1 Tax=Staphylococcus lugdunensis TaxID=28035 RepID=UPI00045B22DC|nr:DNA-3-methyladenine glycosylase [Staphylococcus lugdunensis]ARJ26830.1 DNA-3-methyladenine glycosylase [Staphylococcus lugdunensis]KAK56149.1 DNA-3-methyladenine glycosylase [Staphylococcus lugdunensis VCU150]MCH8672300.1 DNA-3-methyladenine glycosylase [Staphylococcus lugdunensis]MCH8675617.1 DNA-3-methyladenine glycosylase [Staphylococcus lugdunensis]MCI2752278.1 DNA-3-methyladenine glycosylase [Staphylococcus lugdunensis]